MHSKERWNGLHLSKDITAELELQNKGKIAAGTAASREKMNVRAQKRSMSGGISKILLNRRKARAKELGAYRCRS